MLSTDHVVHDTRCRLFNINRREVPHLGQRTRQDDMSIQNGTGCIGNRILLIVALGEHGVESGDRTHPMQTITTALHQRGQLGKARWRIALGGRWLTDGQRDLTLRHGIARERIHQQQYMLALVPKMLSHRSGIRRPLHTQQRRGVGRRSNHHSTPPILSTQNIFNEFFDLAAPLPNQPHHDHISLGIARHHAQQHTLTDA